MPKHKKPCDHISLYPEKNNVGVKARHVCGKITHPKPSAPPYHMMSRVQDDKMKTMKSSSKKNVPEKKLKRIECWVCKPKEKYKVTANTLDKNLQFMSTLGSIVSEGSISLVCSYVTLPFMRIFKAGSDNIHKVSCQLLNTLQV